jgi:hypothetical protein
MTLTVETGTVSGHVELINAIYNFINSNSALVGWSATELTSISSQKQCTVRMGASCYFSFQGATTDTTAMRCFFRPHTSFSPGVSYKSQPGGPTIVENLYEGSYGYQAFSVPISSSFTYYFFADVNYFIGYFSIPTGFYQGFMVGKLDLLGGAVNGYFAKGTTPSIAGTPAYAAYDNVTVVGTWSSQIGVNENEVFTYYHYPLVGPSCHANGNEHMNCLGCLMNNEGVWIGYAYGYGDPTETAFEGFQISGYSNLSALKIGHQLVDVFSTNLCVPLIKDTVYYFHPTLTGRVFPFGEIPGIFFTCLRNIVAESTVTIGSNYYKIFPGKTQNVAHHGQFYGVAIKTTGV